MTIDEMLDKVAESLNIPAAPAATVKVCAEENREVHIKPYVGGRLGLCMAKELAYVTEKAAELLGVRVVTAVCNEGANTVLLHAMDDSYIASIKASEDKAYTAAALKMPTHTALAESRGGSLDGFTNGGRILMLGGGYPLEYDGRIYGGIGVSGGTKEQDTAIAKAGADYFRARMDIIREQEVS